MIEELFSLVTSISVFGIFKLFAIVLVGFHLIFSFVVVRQAVRMTRVVEANVSPVITSLSFLHFAVSLGAFLWTLFLLP